MVNRLISKLRIAVKSCYFHLFDSNITFGKNFRFRKGVILNCSSNGKIIIGSNVFLNNYCSLNAHQKISVGNNCIFGEGVKVYDHNHAFANQCKPIREQGYRCNDVYIGNNCWIGSNVVILAGANIEDNVIIGAGCIVKSHIKANSVVKSNVNYVVEDRC